MADENVTIAHSMTGVCPAFGASLGSAGRRLDRRSAVAVLGGSRCARTWVTPPVTGGSWRRPKVPATMLVSAWPIG